MAKLDAEDNHGGRDAPIRGAFWHTGFYRSRTKAGATVHLRSTHAVAVSFCSDLDHASV
jgi:ribulose-5-phosphate 4-epimerase/fuculose-1-phosphate aldolase